MAVGVLLFKCYPKYFIIFRWLGHHYIITNLNQQNRGGGGCMFVFYPQQKSVRIIYESCIKCVLQTHEKVHPSRFTKMSPLQWPLNLLWSVVSFKEAFKGLHKAITETTCLQTTKEKRQEKPFVQAIALSGQDLRIVGGQFQYVADSVLGSDLDSACYTLGLPMCVFFFFSRVAQLEHKAYSSWSDMTSSLCCCTLLQTRRLKMH